MLFGLAVPTSFYIFGNVFIILYISGDKDTLGWQGMAALGSFTQPWKTGPYTKHINVSHYWNESRVLLFSVWLGLDFQAILSWCPYTSHTQERGNMLAITHLIKLDKRVW